MPDPAHRFIDATVRPLGDNAELEIAARNELAASIDRTGDATGDSLDIAAERLEHVDRRKRGNWWKYILYAVTGIVSVVTLSLTGKSYFLWRNALMDIGFWGSYGWSSSPGTLDKWMAKDLTPEQRLILLGDTSRNGKADQFRALWESDPENPAYFADYATAHISEKSTLPPDFLETGRRLDPGNAWFAILSAGVLAEEAIDRTFRGTTTSPGGLKLKVVKDQGKLDEALALLHEAASEKRFDTYLLDLLEQRIPLVPKRTDSVDQMFPIAYMAGLSIPNMRIRYLADGVSVKAIQLANDDDLEGFRRLLADWDAFADTYVRADHATLVDVMLAMATVRTALKPLQEAATDLGLMEEAARLKALDDRFEARKSALSSRIDPNKDVALRSSILAGLTVPLVALQTARAPVIQPEDLEPGRLADHALMGRVLSQFAWLVLGLTLLAAGLFRFRGSRLNRRLSARLEYLLRPVDWLWIAVIGLLVPLVYYQLIYRFTPLGGREWSLKGNFVSAGQFGAMLLLMVVLPVVIARWRLALRAGCAGMECGRNCIAWVAVIIGALALPLAGASFFAGGFGQVVAIIAGCLLGMLLLYVIFIGSRALFSSHAGVLRRVTVSRVLTPAYAMGMLLMLALVPLYHAEERRWIANDRLLEVSVDAPSMGRFEYEVTQALKQEVVEIYEGNP